MNSHLSYEYYSMVAPVAGAFLADEPVQTPMNPFITTKTLHSIDRGYYIYTSNKPVAPPSTIRK